MNSQGPFLLFVPCYPLLLEKRPLTLPGNKGESVPPRPLYLLRPASDFPFQVLFFVMVINPRAYQEILRLLPALNQYI